MKYRPVLTNFVPAKYRCLPAGYRSHIGDRFHDLEGDLSTISCRLSLQTYTNWCPLCSWSLGYTKKGVSIEKPDKIPSKMIFYSPTLYRWNTGLYRPGTMFVPDRPVYRSGSNSAMTSYLNRRLCDGFSPLLLVVSLRCLSFHVALLSFRFLFPPLNEDI